MFQSGRKRQRDGKGAFTDATDEIDMFDFDNPLQVLLDDDCISSGAAEYLDGKYK